MVSRMTVTLERDERAALARLAMRERRDPRQQAALLIRRGLEQAGELPIDTRPPVADGPVTQPATQGG